MVDEFYERLFLTEIYTEVRYSLLIVIENPPVTFGPNELELLEYMKLELYNTSVSFCMK